MPQSVRCLDTRKYERMLSKKRIAKHCQKEGNTNIFSLGSNRANTSSVNHHSFAQRVSLKDAQAYLHKNVMSASVIMFITLSFQPIKRRGKISKSASRCGVSER